jgi:hypothetical protein
MNEAKGRQRKTKEVLPTITSMCTYNVGLRKEGRSSRVNYEQP